MSQTPSNTCTSTTHAILDTVRDIAIDNKEAGMAIGLAIALTLICYGLSQSAAVVIRAWRKS
ncbi:MAG: hypothetical protein J7647_31460 [Cyanobacteria bacterium SBLK]|nr:hypothetical protein [Cyanobacteria bacterium SBLK]